MKSTNEKKTKGKKNGTKLPRINRNVSVIVRVVDSERDIFNLVCQSRLTTPSKEIRRFIRSYIAEHGQIDIDEIIKGS